MTRRIVLFVFLAALLLSGCATPTAMSRISDEMGADKVKRPDWVYRLPTSRTVHYETGYGRMGTRDASRRRAEMDADSKMAGWASTYVESSLETDTAQEGALVTDAMKLEGTQVAKAILAEVATEDLWVDAEGGVWVLRSVPLARIEAVLAPSAFAQ